MEQGNSCGRDLKVAADRVSQSEQEVIMVVLVVMMEVEDTNEDANDYHHVAVMQYCTKYITFTQVEELKTRGGEQVAENERLRDEVN